MKDTELKRIIELVNTGAGFLPHNQLAHDLLDQSHKGEVIPLVEVTARDIKRHRGYMALLNFIYDYLPQAFHRKVTRGDFYTFLKHLQGKYKVLYEFQDGTRMVEYESISFAKMTEARFREYIKEQMPFIYTEVIGVFFEGDMYNDIVNTIEDEFEKFFATL